MVSPIQHVVIIFKENHTFDNYFGSFPGAEGDITLAPAPDPPASDHPHNRKAWLRRARGAVHQAYGESDIPEYWSYARQFTLCDHYFTDVAGPSTPNHLMVIAADSPLIDNFHRNDPTQPVPPYDLPSLPASLDAAGLSWKNYGGFAFKLVTSLKGSRNNVKADQFAIDAAAGRLPSVSWVFGASGFDEHPVNSVSAGATWTAQQVDAIVEGGLWPSTAIFITWDDWGGWSDHVEPPPSLEPWSDGHQFRLGNRVPCLVVSPFAKSGFISRAQHSHVSLVRFVEDTFGLPPINRRDAASDGMADCFDLTRAPAPPPTTAGTPPPLTPGPPGGSDPSLASPPAPPAPPPLPPGPNPTGLRFAIVSSSERGRPFKFEILAQNGSLIARSEGHASKADTRASIEFLQRGIETAEVIDNTGSPTRPSRARPAPAKKTSAKKASANKAAPAKKASANKAAPAKSTARAKKAPAKSQAASKGAPAKKLR